MSLPVYPTLPNVEQRLMITPIHSTIVQRAASGRTVRIAEYAVPLIKITITYTVLRAAPAFSEFQQLVDFYNLVHGQFGLWNYTSPYIRFNSGTSLYEMLPNGTDMPTVLTCAFDMDQQEFETECNGLWSAKTISFTTVKQ